MPHISAASVPRLKLVSYVLVFRWMDRKAEFEADTGRIGENDNVARRRLGINKCSEFQARDTRDACVAQEPAPRGGIPTSGREEPAFHPGSRRLASSRKNGIDQGFPGSGSARWACVSVGC